MSREPQVSHAASEVPEGKKQGRKEVPIGVVEQRVSNLAQGSLCKWLALFCSNTHMIVITVANKHRSGPHDCSIPACPRSDPQGSPGRSFCTSAQPLCVQGRNQRTDFQWYMGTDALLSSGVTEKMLYLIRDPGAILPSNPLNKVRKSRLILFIFIELIGFGATFAVTQVSHHPHRLDSLAGADVGRR
jgi:hypothetical protein